MNTFVFIGFDKGEMKIGPVGAHRQACVAEPGAKVVVFGSAANLQNINAVRDAGFPCVVRCETRTPAIYAANRFVHTHWVSEESMPEATPEQVRPN